MCGRYVASRVPGNSGPPPQFGWSSRRQHRKRALQRHLWGLEFTSQRTPTASERDQFRDQSTQIERHRTSQIKRPDLRRFPKLKAFRLNWLVWIGTHNHSEPRMPASLSDGELVGSTRLERGDLGCLLYRGARLREHNLRIIPLRRCHRSGISPENI